MEVKFLDLARQYQSIKSEIDGAIARVLARSDFVLGDEVARFEEEFAAYCEAPHAIGVDSGTSALELGLRALDIGPGDEVLVPANSFIASASAVSAIGATPVFVDADPATYTIDPARAADRITPRTRAIMPVHLYGQPADMDAIAKLARRHRLLVVEDACQAHGARFARRRIGSFGDVAAFSFYPGKNLGAYGDGGAVVTRHDAVAERIRILRNCGQREKYHHVCLGGTHRLDTIQAAVLRVKLAHLDVWNELRRTWASIYDELLRGTGLVGPTVAPGAEHVFHLYVVQVDGEAGERAALQRHLAATGIATGIHYPISIHRQEAYAELGYGVGACPVAERCAERVLSLPMFAELGDAAVAYVAEQIYSYVEARQADREEAALSDPSRAPRYYALVPGFAA